MVSILVGLLFTALGLWGLARYLPLVVDWLKAFLSLSLALGGLLAVVFGFLGLRGDR